MPLGKIIEGAGQRVWNAAGPTLWDYVRIGGSGLAVLFVADALSAAWNSTHIGISENYIPNDFKFSGFSENFDKHPVIDVFDWPKLEWAEREEWLKRFGLIALAGIPTADLLWQKSSGHSSHGGGHADGHH